MGYTETTEGITITVHPIYLDGQSDLAHQKVMFAYFVRIQNNTDVAVKLLRRHWIISDSNGEVQEVEGEGVVGKQPLIPPGNVHDYSSFSILKTFEGSMEGTYLMERPDGSQFTVQIPRFTLRAASN